MTTITRRTKKGPDVPALVTAFTEFRRLKRAEAESKKQHEALRDDVLMPALVKFGHDHGEHAQHLAIELPEPIDGLVRLVRRANTSTSIDVDAAEALAMSRGFLTDIQVGTVNFSFTGTPAQAKKVAAALRAAGAEEHAPVLGTVRFDQDRMYAYHQSHRDKLTESDIDGLIVDHVTYSFFPEKS